MPRIRTKALFHRAFCHDCNEFKLQSFSEAEVDKMAQLHGDLCNHEVTIDCTGERAYMTDGDYLLTQEGMTDELDF